MIPHLIFEDAIPYKFAPTLVAYPSVAATFVALSDEGNAAVVASFRCGHCSSPSRSIAENR